jgi:hypothetical protein
VRTLDPPIAPSITQSIRLEDLWQDRYPSFRQLRADSPVAWVPAANRDLITAYADVVAVDKNPAVVSANEHNSLMHRAMGNTMLRNVAAA